MDDYIFIDYIPCKECECMEETYGMICIKCGKCGRKFENGIMIDDGGTTVDEDADI